MRVWRDAVKESGATALTSLDLGDIGFVSASQATFSGTASGGVLTVADGKHAARISLNGDYLSSTFVTVNDGHGGVIVVALPAPGGAPPHAFVAAMAGFGGPAASRRASGRCGANARADAVGSAPGDRLGAGVVEAADLD